MKGEANMGKPISMCGNRCDLCLLYKGNVGRTSLKNINRGFSMYHGFTVKSNDIGCAGCKVQGKQCREDCPIRKCCASRKYDSCAYCHELFCDLLKSDIQAVQNALNGVYNISREDYDAFFKPYEVVKNLNNIKNDIGR